MVKKLRKSGLPLRTSRRGKLVSVTIPTEHIRALTRQATREGDTLAAHIRRIAIRQAGRK